jgi:hypothetical protein
MEREAATAAWRAEQQANYDRYTPTERKIEDKLAGIIGEEAAELVRELVEALIAESRRDHSDD